MIKNSMIFYHIEVYTVFYALDLNNKCASTQRTLYLA